MHIFSVQVIVQVNISSQEGAKAAMMPVQQVAPTQRMEWLCLVTKIRWRVVNGDFVIFLYMLNFLLQEVS